MALISKSDEIPLWKRQWPANIISVAVDVMMMKGPNALGDMVLIGLGLHVRGDKSEHCQTTL